MKDALTTIHAASGAPRGRLACLARLGSVVCALACIGLGSALAQQPERAGRRDEAPVHHQGPRSERFQMPSQAQGEPRADQREEQRRQMQQEQNLRNAEAARRSGRLTPDERRDLRRQINEVGMDIYPNTRRR